jgi:hypothetical protein
MMIRVAAVTFPVELANRSPKGNVLVTMPWYERKTSLYQDLWWATRATLRRASDKPAVEGEQTDLRKSFFADHLHES